MKVEIGILYKDENNDISIEMCYFDTKDFINTNPSMLDTEAFLPECIDKDDERRVFIEFLSKYSKELMENNKCLENTNLRKFNSIRYSKLNFIQDESEMKDFDPLSLYHMGNAPF